MPAKTFGENSDDQISSPDCHTITTDFVQGITDSIPFQYSAILVGLSGRMRNIFAKLLLVNIVFFSGAIYFCKTYYPSQTGDIRPEMLWVVFYPLYIVVFFLNSAIYKDVARTSLELVHKSTEITKKSQPEKKNAGEGVQSFNRDMHKYLVLGFYCIFSVIVSFVPFVGSFVSSLAIAILYTFFCFEYRWASDGKDFEQCIHLFERRWAYFLGFSSLYLSISFLFPSFSQSGLISFLYAFIILQATSVTHLQSSKKPSYTKIGLFNPSKFMAWLLLNAMKPKSD